MDFLKDTLGGVCPMKPPTSAALPGLQEDVVGLQVPWNPQQLYRKFWVYVHFHGTGGHHSFHQILKNDTRPQKW